MIKISNGARLTQGLGLIVAVIIGNAIFATPISGQAECKQTITIAQQLDKDAKYNALTKPREEGMDGLTAITLLLHFDFLGKERDCWVNKLGSGATSMRGAFLFRADMRWFVETSSANRKMDLSNADLTGTDLRGVQLPGSTFLQTVFISANMSMANLADADLRGAYFISANLSGANLSRAILQEAGLRGANLTGADLSGADLTDCGLLNWKSEFDRRTKDNAEFQALPSNRKAEEEARFKVDFKARTSGLTLTGAKASRATKGIDLEAWKARGGIVVD